MVCRKPQNGHRRSKVVRQVSVDPVQSHMAREETCQDETGQADSCMIQVDLVHTCNMSNTGELTTDKTRCDIRQLLNYL